MPDRGEKTRTFQGRTTDRRTVIATGLGAITAGLAGCSSVDSGGATSPTETDAPTTESSQGSTPSIDHPDAVAFDEPFTVEATGLPAGTVDVSLHLDDSTGNEWSIRASYETDDGHLSLDETAPIDRDIGAGTTTLLQRATFDLGTTAFYPSVAQPGTVTVRLHQGGETLATSEFERHVTGGGVDGREVADEGFVGTVYEPPGEDPAPGLVVLHGSEGVPAEPVAAMLASHGFHTVAVHYFEWRDRHEQLPNELVEVPLEFVERAAEWLLEHDRTSGSRVGAWGASKGGELALLAGSYLDVVGPVVSIAGSAYAWEGVAQSMGEPRSSWTYEDEPIPFVPYVRDDTVWDDETPAELEPGYTASFEDAADDRLAEAMIPVGDLDGPVLLVSGGRDRLWDAATLQEPVAERLDGSRVDHRLYEDAGHAIKFPYRPVTNRREGQRYVFGGTPAGYAEADVDHWPRVLSVFDSLKTG